MEWATLYADNKPFLTLRPPSDIPKQTNCPNCCAPINGKRCEYCGTWFIEPEKIEKEKEIPVINQRIDYDTNAHTWLHYELGSQIGNLQNQISQAQAAILSLTDVRNWALWSENPKPDPVPLDYNKVTSLQNSLGPSFIQIDIPVEEIIKNRNPKENWLQKFIHKIIGG